MSKINRTTRIAVSLALAALAGTVGLSVVNAGGAGTSSQVAPRSEPVTTTPTPDATPSTQVTPKPIHSVGTQVGKVHTTVTVGKMPTVPKATQTVTNTSTQVTVTPSKPRQTSTPKPTTTTSTTAKECPDTRSANPSVWDACRAGYIAPSIQFSGIISCQAVDKAAGIWKIVRKYEMVGGNYRSADWSGLGDNNTGTSVLTLRGYPTSALSQPIYIQLKASIYVHSMNGLPGDIDTVERFWDEDVVLAKVCS